MTDRETFRTLISQRQHEAEEALVRGDVGPRLQMWSHNDPVTLFAALGASKSGWGELEPTFRSVASRVSGGHDVAYELISFDVSGDLAWTVAFSRFTASIDGGPLTHYTLRVTHLYRREGGEWKVVHEHSDFQPSDHAMSASSSGSLRIPNASQQGLARRGHPHRSS
jgi:ketosteroid isomerase-like protein